MLTTSYISIFKTGPIGLIYLQTELLVTFSIYVSGPLLFWFSELSVIFL